MKKQTKDLEQIAQQDVDCIMLTGKNVKHVTKSEILEAALKCKAEAIEAHKKHEESIGEIFELSEKLQLAKENERRENFTEVPTEEFNDAIKDIERVSKMLRKIVLDRVDGIDKQDLILDCFQAAERVHCFCIGRANASSEVAEEY